MRCKIDEPGFIALPETTIGLGSIANIYISDISPNASVTPSGLFINLSTTIEISENTKSILREVFDLNENQIPT